MDVHQKQRCVIEFLNAEEVKPINIHKCLVNVYGGKRVNVSIIRRWICCFQSGDKDVSAALQVRKLQSMDELLL